MTLDMKFFNVYYFCNIANGTMGNLDFYNTYYEFIEQESNYPAEDFPEKSILRDYCYWLVERIFFEQANHFGDPTQCLFNPLSWLAEAIQLYFGIDILKELPFDAESEDYLDNFVRYTECLDSVFDGLCFNLFSRIAIEVEYLLFQNREFLLRFNTDFARCTIEQTQKRAYLPEWVKRAVLFRDKGCCVFCKKDLTGLYTLLEDNEKHFDHIVPLAKGGLNDVCNLQLSCKNCNSSKNTKSKTSSIYHGAY